MSDASSLSATSYERLTAKNKLSPKQEQLANQITQGRYKSLAGILIDKVGGLLDRLSRRTKPRSFWFHATVFFIITVVLSWFIVLFHTPSRSMPLVESSSLIFGPVLLAMGAFFVIVGAQTYTALLTVLHRNVVTMMALEADIADLEHYLIHTFSLRMQLIIAVIVGFLILGIEIYIGRMVNLVVDVPYLILTSMYGFETATCVPIVFIFTPVLLARLSNYRYRIYPVDPSNSSLIYNLSNIIGNVVLKLAFIMALWTLLMYAIGFLGFEFVIAMTIIPWVLLITIFSIGHYALSKIITNVKRNRLDEIQFLIGELESQDTITEKETMEKIDRLISYHDKITATPNSSLNAGVILRFLQSLLLPLLASLLGSIKDVIQLFPP